MDYKAKALETVREYFTGAWAPDSEGGLVATIARDLQEAHEAGAAKYRGAEVIAAVAVFVTEWKRIKSCVKTSCAVDYNLPRRVENALHVLEEVFMQPAPAAEEKRP